MGDPTPPIVTRFAPSPTGMLHLGHARAAWFAHDIAREAGGRFLLRLEDIDRSRCRPEYARAILADLDWLGIAWDGPVRVQSRHLAEHGAALDRLEARGLVYPCFCSRAEILREVAAAGSAPHDPDGAPLYPGTCRTIPAVVARARVEAGAPHCRRLDMRRALAAAGDAFRAEGLDPARFGDVVLARRDVPTGYHWACTHDDEAQGVTLVTRAVDLAPAAELHALLQELMGWRRQRYRFHPLLRGPDGRRLAKRDGAASIASLREAGATPADIRRLASD